MNYNNRFFLDQADAGSNKKVFSPEQALALLAVAEEKVSKLCLVKGKEGAPQQALFELSLLKEQMKAIMQAAPKSENAPRNERDVAATI